MGKLLLRKRGAANQSEDSAPNVLWIKRRKHHNVKGGNVHVINGGAG